MDIQCGGHHHELAEKATRFDISTAPMVRLYHHLFCPTDLSSIININQLFYWIQIIQKSIMFIIFIMLKKMVNPLNPHVSPHSFVVRFNQALGHEDWFNWQLWGSTKHEMNLQRGPRNDS